MFLVRIDALISTWNSILYEEKSARTECNTNRDKERLCPKAEMNLLALGMIFDYIVHGWKRIDVASKLPVEYIFWIVTLTE